MPKAKPIVTPPHIRNPLPRAANAARRALSSRHPDAELLAACAAFEDLAYKRESLFEGPTALDDDSQRHAGSVQIEATQDPFLEQICRTPATTLEGCFARAKAIVWDSPDMMPDFDAKDCGGYPAERMVAALIRDLLNAPKWAVELAHLPVPVVEAVS
jgi:hypothetical protein